LLSSNEAGVNLGLIIWKKHYLNEFDVRKPLLVPPITYYWTGLLILNHSHLVGNLTNSKIAETKKRQRKQFNICPLLESNELELSLIAKKSK
jgi:hypothetical protein